MMIQRTRLKWMKEMESGKESESNSVIERSLWDDRLNPAEQNQALQLN